MTESVKKPSVRWVAVQAVTMHLEREVTVERIYNWVVEQLGEDLRGNINSARSLLWEILGELSRRWCRCTDQGMTLPLNSLQPGQKASAETLITGIFGTGLVDAVLRLRC